MLTAFQPSHDFYAECLLPHAGGARATSQAGNSCGHVAEAGDSDDALAAARAELAEVTRTLQVWVYLFVLLCFPACPSQIIPQNTVGGCQMLCASSRFWCSFHICPYPHFVICPCSQEARDDLERDEIIFADQQRELEAVRAELTALRAAGSTKHAGAATSAAGMGGSLDVDVSDVTVDAGTPPDVDVMDMGVVHVHAAPMDGMHAHAHMRKTRGPTEDEVVLYDDDLLPALSMDSGCGLLGCGRSEVRLLGGGGN